VPTMGKRFWWLAVIGISLAACSTDDLSGITGDDSLAAQTIGGSVKGAFDAVKSPFIDLNFTRDEIPAKLQTISGSPYALPSPLQCKVVREELKELDALLGSDMQSLTNDEDVDYAQEGADALQSTAIGFVAGKVSIIPFRGMVRRITGAAQHEKEYARAYETGKLRRAYLKGWSSALKCDKVKKPAAILAQKESKSL
jgi:hypothetical protein